MTTLIVAGETNPTPLAPDSAAGSTLDSDPNDKKTTKENANRDPRLSVKTTVKTNIVIPVQESKIREPGQLEIWQETQLSLLKSQFILGTAIEQKQIRELSSIKNRQPNMVEWLQDNLTRKKSPG